MADATGPATFGNVFGGDVGIMAGNTLGGISHGHIVAGDVVAAGMACIAGLISAFGSIGNYCCVLRVAVTDRAGKSPVIHMLDNNVRVMAACTGKGRVNRQTDFVMLIHMAACAGVAIGAEDISSIWPAAGGNGSLYRCVAAAVAGLAGKKFDINVQGYYICFGVAVNAVAAVDQRAVVGQGMVDCAVAVKAGHQGGALAQLDRCFYRIRCIAAMADHAVAAALGDMFFRRIFTVAGKARRLGCPGVVVGIAVTGELAVAFGAEYRLRGYAVCCISLALVNQGLVGGVMAAGACYSCTRPLVDMFGYYVIDMAGGTCRIRNLCHVMGSTVAAGAAVTVGTVHGNSGTSLGHCLLYIGTVAAVADHATPAPVLMLSGCIGVMAVFTSAVCRHEDSIVKYLMGIKVVKK